ncbi:hypothetical protein VNO77_29947 [Canavalia gladiata]|uniref:PPC domain-containing protein n=1 Tax=Canavalia gladiata TaxID=3824 RepID=A0AAN9KMM5_CANGL
MATTAKKGSLNHNTMNSVSLSSGKRYISFANNNNDKKFLPSPSPSPDTYDVVLSHESKKQVQSQNMMTPAKRGRGRPPGSKNKPKVPVVIVEEDTNHVLKPIIIEIPNGADVVDSLINFARKHYVSVTVLSISGYVSEATICQPFSHSPTLSLSGTYRVVHLSGSYITTLSPSPSSKPLHSTFGIQLAMNDNKVIGGLVGGRVIAAGPMVVLLSKFKNHHFHRLHSNPNPNPIIHNPDPYGISINSHGGVSGINNNSMPNNVSNFGVAASTSSRINIQLPSNPIVANVHSLKWNNPTHHNNY